MRLSSLLTTTLVSGTASELHKVSPPPRPTPTCSCLLFSMPNSAFSRTRGRKVELPEGVHGVVLREKPCPDGVREDNEDVTSYWAAETSFRDVMVRDDARTYAHTHARRKERAKTSSGFLVHSVLSLISTR